MAGEFTGVSTQGGNIPWDPNSKVDANKVIGMNTAGNFLNMLADGAKSIMNYKLMGRMLDLQTTQMTKYYDLQNSLVDLQGSIVGSQEKVAIKQLTTTKEIAELQKDQNIAIAKAKVDGAVKIAKVNALNAQFYGKPANNQLGA